MKSLLKFVALTVLGSPLLLANFVGALPSHKPFKHICPNRVSGEGRCHSHVVTDANGKPLASSTPPGSAYTPAQFHTAYNLPSTATVPQTIGIVVAYNSPTIENDLNVYSQQFGLPACTTANGCFTKVNQNGIQGSYPATDTGWALEMALDVEVAHAICPNCKIVLVEANSSSLNNLFTAVDTAVNMGATVISNSYGGGEFYNETFYDSHFNHPGVAFTVSSGDSGYGVEYPAASRFVTAVGGTTLKLNPDNTRQSETAWSGAGSGCSAYEPKPSFQSDTKCSKRTVADVSADADPNTGAAIYTATNSTGQASWFQVGGTSLSAPLIAGVYALSGNVRSTSYASYPYFHPSLLNDVTSGSNGSCGNYLCQAGSGYDGPTGLGTPNGTGGF